MGMSPPTRVAWIETENAQDVDYLAYVATHTGGVDRNFAVQRRLSANKRRHPHGWRG